MLRRLSVFVKYVELYRVTRFLRSTLNIIIFIRVIVIFIISQIYITAETQIINHSTEQENINQQNKNKNNIKQLFLISPSSGTCVQKLKPIV